MLSSKCFIGNTAQLSWVETDLRDIKSLAGELRICIFIHFRQFFPFIYLTLILYYKNGHIFTGEKPRSSLLTSTLQWYEKLDQQLFKAEYSDTRGIHMQILGGLTLQLILHTSGKISERKASC